MKSISIRGYLLTGLVVWLPIVVTFVVLRFIIDLMDQTISLLPKSYQPEQLLGFHLPGLGVIVSFVLLFITGMVVTNFFGQRLVEWGEAVLQKIPLVRSIYNATKQVISTILSSDSQAFRQVMLVEYPRKGIWSVAFQTGVAAKEVDDLTKNELISIFVPTTPNPTSGYLMMIPKKDAIELDMTVDEALKFIISLGVMQPKPAHVPPLKTQNS